MTRYHEVRLPNEGYTMSYEVRLASIRLHDHDVTRRASMILLDE